MIMFNILYRFDVNKLIFELVTDVGVKIVSMPIEVDIINQLRIDFGVIHEA